jgi:peptidoglycan/LPS O-acetylase OafA/YrhL
MSFKYVPSLDGLRGYAVLFVILFHCGVIFWGWIGVQLFFTLSGFLITLSLFSGKSKGLKAYLKNFYMRRALRIFPLYFLFLALVFVYLSVFKEGDANQSWLYLLTYTFNIFRSSEIYQHSMLYGHLWSLSVEEQFYVFWPFLIFFLPKEKLLKTLLSVLVFYVLLKLALLVLTIANVFDVNVVVRHLYFQTFSQADAFIYGAVAAYLYTQKKLFSPNLCLALILGLLCLAFSVEILRGESILSSLRLMSSPAMFDDNVLFGFGYTLMGLFALLLINYVVGGADSKVKAIFFENQFIVYTGKISYGLYIFHYPIIHILEEKLYPQSDIERVLLYVAGIILTYAISALSYKYFESPLLALKSRYT